jgi:hypothetical protein
MMSGLSGPTGPLVLWNVVVDISIELGLVRGEQMSVKGLHICLVIATHINAKVRIVVHLFL